MSQFLRSSPSHPRGCPRAAATQGVTAREEQGQGCTSGKGSRARADPFPAVYFLPNDCQTLLVGSQLFLCIREPVPQSQTTEHDGRVEGQCKTWINLGEVETSSHPPPPICPRHKVRAGTATTGSLFLPCLYLAVKALMGPSVAVMLNIH